MSRSEAKDCTSLSPSFIIKMDGSVQNNRKDYASLTDADQNGTLRQRVKPQQEEVPDNSLRTDLESNEKEKPVKKQPEQNVGDTDHEADVGNDDLRTLPRNTFSFLIIARYPFCENARRENDDRRSIIQIQSSKTRDHLCVPFWCSLGILILQITIYTLALL